MDTRHITSNRHDDELDDELNEHWHQPGDPDGVVAEEVRRRQEQGHPKPPHSPVVHYRLKKYNWHMPKIPAKPALGVVLIMASLAAAYWMGFQRAIDPPKKSIAHEQVHGQTAETITAPITHYNSTNYSIGISYPNNWIVSDTTDKMTITSPNFTMLATSGTAIGHIIVTIQNQQTSIAGFPSGGATASLASDIVAYAQPTSVQRAQTYISYLGYTDPNGIDALYLTGDSGYEQGQSVPTGDITKGDPLIGVGFAKCSVSYCTKGTPTPITLQAKSWNSAKFKATILSVLQSLTVNP